MQKVKEAVIELVRACGGLTHAALADEANINRGQLTAWLAGKRPLSDQRVRSLVKVILGHATNPKVLSLELQQAYADRIDHLRSFLGEMMLPVSGGEREVPVDGPLPVGHPAFCMRECEEELEKYLKVRPFTVGIRGGRKTGKSTAARWLAAKLRLEGPPVLYFDFSPPNQFNEMAPNELFAWLDQQARDQLPEASLSPLRKWQGFVGWVGENLLRYRQVDDRYASLFFDGIENLPPKSQIELVFALQSLRNQKAKKPEYSYINVLCVFDPKRVYAPPGSQHMPIPGSFLAFAPFPRAGNIPLKGLATLVELRLKLKGDEHIHKRNSIMDYLWAQFAGHPWLTQAWLNFFAKEEALAPSNNLKTTQRNCDKELAEEFANPKNGIAQGLEGLVNKILVQHLNEKLDLEEKLEKDLEEKLEKIETTNYRITVTAFSELSESINWVHLAETGLFFSGEEDTSTLCCTRWVAQRLVESARYWS